MPVRHRRYALDTNIYVDAFRDAAANAALQAFHTGYAPFEHLSAVVVQELCAGAKPAQGHALQRSVFEPFERRGRLFTPSYAAWKQTGEVLAELTARKVLDWRSISRSIVNDVLLATSCREEGIMLVTRNVADFERIARVMKFDFRGWM